MSKEPEDFVGEILIFDGEVQGLVEEILPGEYISFFSGTHLEDGVPLLEPFKTEEPIGDEFETLDKDDVDLTSITFCPDCKNRAEKWIFGARGWCCAYGWCHVRCRDTDCGHRSIHGFRQEYR